MKNASSLPERGRPNRRSRFWAPALAGSMMLLLLSCSREKPLEAVRNVLIISMDTTRQDHLGCYGYHRSASVDLDEFARESSTVVFRNAYSTSPWTLPAHASLLTGLYPQVHGAVLAGDLTEDGSGPLIARLPEGATTLAGLLRARGFHTAAFVSAPLMKRAFGLAQGFELYDDAVPLKRSDEADDPTPKRPAAATVQAALAWMREHAGESKLTLVHLFDPHKPYDCPDEFTRTVEDDHLNPYDLEIRYMTHQIGVLLGKLGEMGERERTLIVISSDHGESFGEIHDGRREVGHGKTLYDEVVRNALLIGLPSWWDGKASGEIADPVQIVDVMPTVLDMLGLELPADLRGDSRGGRSLVPLLEGRREEAPRDLLLHLGLNRCAPVRGTRYEARLEGLIAGPWKLVRSSREGADLLFDLVADPEEVTNLAESNPDELRRLGERLDEILSRLKPLVDTPAPPDLDEALRQSLETLGYLR